MPITGYQTELTSELKDVVAHLEEVARNAGLDFFPTVFELIDYKELSEIAAYGGFPTRYPHWRFGMEYEQLSKSYTYGLSIIYEMVINNNPCYAYLLRANNMVFQKTVIAHVFGHCDFFKMNYWFSQTNRKMLDQMANHASLARSLINELGHDVVESFIDCCLSLENLIDIHAPFKDEKSVSERAKEKKRDKSDGKMKSKKYMDSYINPKDVLDAEKKAEADAKKGNKPSQAKPERDVLKFLIDHAPLPAWQRQILEMIRDEAYYFAPQGQTKILNEGWAVYWHSKMMTELAPLDASEIIDYCDHYAGVVAMHPGQLNPYKMGVELLRHVKDRWDKGRFGLEYLDIDDPKVRAQWDKDLGLGTEKIFEIRKIHNDITFLDEFLDEDFCHATKMFIYDFDRRTNRYLISDRDFKPIKQRLLHQLTNFGQPIITAIDGNFKNRGELLLRHKFEGSELKADYITETLKNLYVIWQRPVHIETVLEEVKRRISYDGTNTQNEKI